MVNSTNIGGEDVGFKSETQHLLSVTLRKVHNLSVPQFLYLQIGGIICLPALECKLHKESLLCSCLPSALNCAH